MPFFNNVTYPGGGMNIASQVPGVQPGGGQGIDPQLYALIDMAMKRKQAPVGPGAMMTRSRPSYAASGPEHRSMASRESERLDLAAKRAQVAALTNPQPLRMVGGPGIVPGYTPDTLAMSGAQRKMFLPDTSGNAPDRDAAAENLRRAGNETAFENFRVTSGADKRGRGQEYQVATFGKRGRLA